MIKLIAYIATIVLLSYSNDVKDSGTLNVPQIAIVPLDFDGLEKYIEQQTAEVVVINFWATWCKPCIKELPIFEEIGKRYTEDRVKVILVSLDFPDQISKVEEFIKRKDLKSDVVLLNDPDANRWIPLIR